MALNTCALYGSSNYTNSWIGINLLVILASLTFIALAYALGSILPTKTRSQVIQAVRSELTQIILSAAIIAILIASSQMMCGISASYTQKLTGTSLSPFQYADSYVGNLATNTGIALLEELYTKSVAYYEEAQVMESVIDSFGQGVSNIGASSSGKNPWFAFLGELFGEGSAIPRLGEKIGVTLSIGLPGLHLYESLFDTLAHLYVSIFSGLVTLATGMLLLQYILLIVAESAAFTILLPIAILMRSISFAGIGLRQSANTFLAIAIALYLVFPLTIAYNGVLMHYVLATVGQPYLLTNLNINSFFSSMGNEKSFTTLGSTAMLALNSLPSFSTPLPGPLVQDVSTMTFKIAEFLFQAVALFAINISITVGFAASLTKALNSGVEGTGSFWSNI